MPGISKALGSLMKGSLACAQFPASFQRTVSCRRFSVSLPPKRTSFQSSPSVFLRARFRSYCTKEGAAAGFGHPTFENEGQNDAREAETGVGTEEAIGSTSAENESDIGTTKVENAGSNSSSSSYCQESETGEEQEAEQDKARVKAQGQRRSRSPLPDLLTVKGIGPRNMEKLVSKGIANLVELKQLYRDKFRSGGLETVVSYLVESVGVHKNHANVIASFIKDAVEKEIASENIDLPKPKKRLTFCVEGNISVGKTTFLQRIANETVELRDLVEVVPEPIGKWQDIGEKHHNVLDAFYAAPARYAYTFQNYVFVTRFMQERESANGLKPLRLMERSVFSDKMVFVRAVHEAKWMSDMELNIYESWFDPVVAELPGLVPDGFIYLRASPDACHKRLQMRKRPEEQTVTLDYLKDLHEKHEQWLFPSTTGTGSVLSLKEWSPMLQQPPSGIKDRVFYLEGDHVHSCIRKVPALVLDCEASIDFSRDIEAKAAYARQVADFFEYVKKTADDKCGNNLLSAQAAMRSPGILGPDGLLLHH